ncbi:MAG: hypothetical protein WCJ35_28810, partial [Planctomycetota bacterium]
SLDTGILSRPYGTFVVFVPTPSDKSLGYSQVPLRGKIAFPAKFSILNSQFSILNSQFSICNSQFAICNPSLPLHDHKWP